MWLIIALLVGALVGYLLSRLWRFDRSRQFNYMLLGMIGAFFGNRLFETIGSKIGEEITQIMNLQLLTAVIGASMLTLFIRVVRK
jgi:uncharacterized membrane protein YeaQ/YmgE (transglycosylase-associated protein family)